MMLDELVSELMPECPEAPIATLREAVIMAARDLCDEASVWRVKGRVVYAASSNYPQFVVPSGAQVLRILWLEENGSPLYSERDYALRPDGTIELSRRRDTSVLEGEVACRPVRNILDLPDEFTFYQTTLVHGALYRLLRMPRKPWSDPGSASYYRQQFSAGCSEARRDATLGFDNGRSRVKPQRF